MNRDLRNHLLFEVSTEVCNKVGGIYSVLKTKAPITVKEYGNQRYHCLGLLNKGKYEVEVEPMELSYEILHSTCSKEKDDDYAVKEAILRMRDRGVNIVYCKWLIEGTPKCILFDLDSVRNDYLNDWKKDLWEISGIPSPDSDFETNDAILLGYLVTWFLGEVVYVDNQKHAIVNHCHEWLAGVCLPIIRQRKLDVVTIFTTHATLLGRYLCAGKDEFGNDIDFYNNLDKFDCDKEAGIRGIYHRYCIERASAHSADVFTTVSQITALEAEHLLARKPDGILPNGINITKFQAVHEFQNLHQKSKLKIQEFIKGHFIGHLKTIDLDNTLYFFIAGRYEFKNKGVDIFIESLARLNHRLQSINSPITVVAFIIMPAKNNSFNIQSLKNHAIVKSLEEGIEDVSKILKQRLLEYTLNKNSIPSNLNELLGDNEKIFLKKKLIPLKNKEYELPSVVTHNMIDSDKDPILSDLRRTHLFNNDNDRVKVIFHPEFLNSQNPLLPMEYEEFVRGCNLGVFPSYYEPWGYTPAECTVMGIPSITTNLSGFGAYMEDLIDADQSEMYGIYIVDRRFKSGDESIEQLTNMMFDFCQKSRRQRINQRNRNERLSELLDWKRMGLEYVKARSLALRRAYYPEGCETEGFSSFENDGKQYRVGKPFSVPGSPRANSNTILMTPGDLGTIQDAIAIEDDDYFHLSMGDQENETESL
ncbi:hypothetical protein QEN19_003461 [Hanseniaspora menglaensis]